MELKEYQKKTVEKVKLYLESLTEFKEKNDKLIKSDPELSINFPLKAWEKVNNASYYSKKNGLGEELPDFYLKIPTGGGKTILACHAIDLINRIYLKKQTGIVLWIVPTTQIYRQTLDSLKNREHPYRQVLDISSGGRTVILEKTDKFNRLDVNENLVVMLLMLPSASRQNKDVLKVFKDSGGFTDFFPPEDDRAGNEKLLKEFPNLDYFGEEYSFYGKIVKTSLGNTLRTLKPIIIIDEGHKAYSEIAQNTIRNFNPSIIVELSATPPKNSNILVNISGQELNRADMIKLDLHVNGKLSLDWKDTMLTSVEKRNFLEQQAKEYEANTGEHIRPICLIQAERTGKEQRGTRYIHAEDVKEYLITQCGISPGEIAIKSSEKDDIEGIDLLSKTCQIRYIITKHALQEGWDCAFAYILTILTNPSSQLSMTQLVGRILRQPRARKTKVKDLDESYVFCFQHNAKELLENVRKGFESEGLGDLAGRVFIDEGDADGIEATNEKPIGYRENFKNFEGRIYLPKFVIQEKSEWRDINYEMDILRRIDWNKINLDALNEISLSASLTEEQEIVFGLGDDKELVKEKGRVSKKGGLEINKVFMTRQILDIIPNPWIAYEIGSKALNTFLLKHDEKIVANNLVYIIEELRKHLEKEGNKLAEQVFRDLVKQKILCFFLLSGKGGYTLPSHINVKNNSKALVRYDNSPIQRSLFDFVPEEDFNEMEKSVAIYLDEQEKLLWWYRNLSRQGYYIQGWRKHKIYPDFVFSDKDETRQNDYRKVYVVETKGVHLKKNEDSVYKENVFDFCNKLGQQKDWEELNLEFSDKKIEFQVIFGDEWRKSINKIFSI